MAPEEDYAFLIQQVEGPPVPDLRICSVTSRRIHVELQETWYNEYVCEQNASRIDKESAGW